MGGAAAWTLRDQRTGSGESCRTILDQLPTWFGIPEANDDYVRAADTSHCVLASLPGEGDVGIVNIRLHSPYAAEVHLMAVVPRMHRQGMGTAMLRHVEVGLARDGVEFLQVKTLSSKKADEGYAKTRAFYEAYGFRVLEEFPDLWDPSNPAVQLVKTVG